MKGGLSRGFGFIEFEDKNLALKMMKTI